MENTVYANNIELRGFIVHKYEAPKATILTISTGRSGDVINYPKVVLFGDLIEQAKQYNVYDNITVYGNAQSSRREKDGKQFMSQSIFAEKIEPTPKELEENFGINGSKYAPPKNVVKIAGSVYNISTPARNLVKLTLHTVKNGRSSLVQVSYYTKEVGKVMERIRVKDNVCGIGSVQTSKKEIRGETRYLETIVLTDLQKIA